MREGMSKIRGGGQCWRGCWGWRESEREHTILSLAVLIWIITAENNALTVSGNELFEPSDHWRGWAGAEILLIDLRLASLYKNYMVLDVTHCVYKDSVRG